MPLVLSKYQLGEVHDALYSILSGVSFYNNTKHTAESLALIMWNNILIRYRSDKGFKDLLVDPSDFAKFLGVQPTFKTGIIFRPRRVKTNLITTLGFKLHRNMNHMFLNLTTIPGLI